MELGGTQAAVSTCEKHMHPKETCLIKMVFCTRNLQAKHTSPVDIGTKSPGKTWNVLSWTCSFKTNGLVSLSQKGILMG